MISLAHHYPLLKVTDEPDLEPVPVEDALAFAEYEGCDAESRVLFTSLLLAARRKVERDADVALITQERTAVFDCFPECELEIHVHPVQSIDEITYRDGNGTLTTLSASDYQSDLHNVPARVMPAVGLVWPLTQWDRLGAVTIVLTAGYGATPATVPEEAKLAIKLLAKEYFWNRCIEAPLGRNAERAYGSLIEQLSWRPLFV